jgi:nudix-type nucleoside diphosphatase (YffH/AdpP family)
MIQSAWQLEIIAGVLDGNESPETCIRRESLEESGCEINELQHLFSFYPSAGACAEFFHLYAAEVDLPSKEASLAFQMKEKIFNSICLITLKSRCYSKIIA